MQVQAQVRNAKLPLLVTAQSTDSQGVRPLETARAMLRAQTARA